ncbi:TMEM165/GDT1 family protein [Lipingzhangella sp. LS1_29]|uniref:GDT1 family protein n=1 Tax=Lipingzhangella rawalii TaxID=2055835 RepID=A0ABU2H587_9ACTN|nr:TMEM165/GDT1 family protein [Lipingzhangella rawalii]MDS1269975.1 TMEM165/GDT1 family protein [Lipingzhangella rawalii]
MEFLLAFGISAAVLFVAEMGDKTQLVAMSLAGRYRLAPVLAGITISTAAIHGISVFVAQVLGLALPTSWLTLLAGVVFLGFGAWTLREEPPSTSGQEPPSPRRWGSALGTVTVISFVAELGDKSMFATVAVATQYPWFPVWLGSTIGMVLAGVLAILLGAALRRRLPERVMQVGAAVVFLLAGAAMTGQGAYLLLA